MRIFKFTVLAFVAAAVLSTDSSGQQTEGQLEMLPLDCVQSYPKLQFDKDEDQSLLLDLYVPEKTASTPPLLLWIHGGEHNDSKSRLDSIMLDLTDDGYAVASFVSPSIGLSARPQHLKDCKGAIRWLQARADGLGYDATRIGVVGGSGAAALALMLGTTADVDELEGVVAGNLDQSSRVHAVVSFHEPGDVIDSLKDRQRSRNQNLSSDALLSADSSLKFLTPDDAPLLIIQGNQHTSVRVSQSRLLYERYQQTGLEATLCTLEVTGSDGPHFSDRARYAMVKAFFDTHIKQIPRDIFAEEARASTTSTEAQGKATSNTQAQTDRRSQRRVEAGKRFAARGAQVGQAAPDVTVYTFAGEPIKLSSLWNHKPAVLVAGSITCPIAYRNCPSLKPLQDDYGEAVNVVILYQREAHPKPEVQAANRPTNRFRGSTAEQYPQPKTLDERLTLAKLFDDHMSGAVRIVVADISNDVNESLVTGPNMGLLIDRDGKIIVKQGWYDGEAMRTEVAELLARGPK